MARKRQMVTSIQQWVLVCEDDARRNSSVDMTANELAQRNLYCLDPEILAKWLGTAPGQRLADHLRLRKDEYGARLNGCFSLSDPESGRSRNIWKPFDAMRAEQIRAAFDVIVSSAIADIDSLLATEERCNDLLQSRHAQPLNPAWRDRIKAKLDGETDELSPVG